MHAFYTAQKYDAECGICFKAKVGSLSLSDYSILTGSIVNKIALFKLIQDYHLDNKYPVLEEILKDYAVKYLSLI